MRSWRPSWKSRVCKKKKTAPATASHKPKRQPSRIGRIKNSMNSSLATSRRRQLGSQVKKSRLKPSAVRKHQLTLARAAGAESLDASQLSRPGRFTCHCLKSAVFLPQRLLIFDEPGVDRDTGYRAHLYTLGLIEMANAFSAFVRINLVDFRAHKDSAVRALRLANITVDALIGDDQGHGLTFAAAYKLIIVRNIMDSIIGASAA